MATFIMIPNGTTTINWSASDGGTPTYQHIDNDNGDTEYLSSDTNLQRIIVDLVDPPVAEADINMSAGITVTLKFSGQKEGIGLGQVIVLQTGTAADSSAISNGTETMILNIGSYTTQGGTAFATSDGSNAWVYGDLAGLRLRVNQHRNPRFGQNRISYLYAEVSYTKATTDNATFFGANF